MVTISLLLFSELISANLKPLYIFLSYVDIMILHDLCFSWLLENRELTRTSMFDFDFWFEREMADIEILNVLG